jgi:hypothetical protein
MPDSQSPFDCEELERAAPASGLLEAALAGDIAAREGLTGRQRNDLEEWRRQWRGSIC